MMMRYITDGPEPYELCKADSSGIRFKVRYPTGRGLARLALTSKDCPQTNLYQFYLGVNCRFVDCSSQQVSFTLPERLAVDFQEFWLTWYNGVICFGMEGQQEPFFQYPGHGMKTYKIGCVKFYMSTRIYRVDWFFEESPMTSQLISHKQFDDGKLRWESMIDCRLPPDALIGGFEDEPIYIARSNHNRSLCPGKYVPSKHRAFVPWGHREHSKEIFEILCGYNAKWVKIRSNNIPENAFVAGTSEVRNEPLYIGRAMHDGNLLTGKVHVLYKTCYLPYKGKEIEVGSYEILVSADVIPRGIIVQSPN